MEEKTRRVFQTIMGLIAEALTDEELEPQISKEESGGIEGRFMRILDNAYSSGKKGTRRETRHERIVDAIVNDGGIDLERLFDKIERYKELLSEGLRFNQILLDMEYLYNHNQHSENRDRFYDRVRDTRHQEIKFKRRLNGNKSQRRKDR